MKRVFLLIVVAAVGCGPVDAATTCAKLEKAKVASHCEKQDGNVVAAVATSATSFDAGDDATGSVYAFDSDESFRETFKSLDELADLTHESVLKNEKRRVIVVLGDETPNAKIHDAREVVSGL